MFLQILIIMVDATKLQIYSFSIIVIFNYTMKYNFLQFLPVTVVYIITAIEKVVTVCF